MIELQQNSCVLPSSTPTLAGNGVQDFDFAFSNRVLRERSANGQREVFGCPEIQSRNSRRPSPSVKGRLSKYPRGSSKSIEDPLGRTPAQVEEEFRQLWEYVWNAQEAQPFVEYRNRQPNCKEGKDGQKWPDDLEFLFFKALVKWPPVGRQKYVVNGHLKGRNEVICMSLEEWSGQSRCRKQISSHIQNIRPMFEDCPRVLRLIPKENKSSKSKQPLQRTRDRGFRPNKFDIKLYPGRDEKGELKKPSHLYTTLKKKPPRDVDLPFESLPLDDYSAQYPQLVSYYASGQLDPNVPILLFDASLEITPEALSNPNELGIEFDLTSTHPLDVFERFESSVEFQRWDSASQTHVPIARKRKDFAPDHNGDPHSLHTVPFGSEVWAKKISHLSRQLRDASILARRDAGSAHEHAARAHEAVRRNLAGLTVVQQIFGWPVGYQKNPADCSPQRLLYCFWRFRQAEPGNAETVYRRIVVSSSDPRMKRDMHASATATPTLGSSHAQSLAYPELDDSFATDAGLSGFDFDTSGAVDFVASQPYLNGTSSVDIGDLGTFDMDMGVGLPGPVQGESRPLELHHPQPCHSAVVPAARTLDLGAPQIHPAPGNGICDNEVDFSAGHIEIALGQNGNLRLEEPSSVGSTAHTPGTDNGQQAAVSTQAGCYTGLSEGIPSLGQGVEHVDQMQQFDDRHLEHYGQQQWGGYDGFYETNLGQIQDGFAPPVVADGHHRPVEQALIPRQRTTFDTHGQHQFPPTVPRHDTLTEPGHRIYSNEESHAYEAVDVQAPYLNPEQRSGYHHETHQSHYHSADAQRYQSHMEQGAFPTEGPQHCLSSNSLQPYENHCVSSQYLPQPTTGSSTEFDPQTQSELSSEQESFGPHCHGETPYSGPSPTDTYRQDPQNQPEFAQEQLQLEVMNEGRMEHEQEMPEPKVPQDLKELLGSPFTTPSAHRFHSLERQIQTIQDQRPFDG